MKNSKRWIAGCTFAFALSLSSLTALAAASYTTPAEALAGVTGKTVDEVLEERLSGKTYEEIAESSDKLDEFRAAMLEMKQAVLDEQVTDGQLTQAEADALMENYQNQTVFCDGSGSCYQNGIGQACAGTGLCLGSPCYTTTTDSSVVYSRRHHNGCIVSGQHHGTYTSTTTTTSNSSSTNNSSSAPSGSTPSTTYRGGYHNGGGHHGGRHH